ncbi:MAG: hypothetical protein KG028_02330, partial [Actinobacteria bacterium]|nr:hypothetical protein [Actinomycetota bacterium]
SVTEAGETPKTDVEQATTESLPPQSGPMAVETVVDSGAGREADTEADAPVETPAAAEGDGDAKPTDQVADETSAPEQGEDAGKEGES